MRTGVLLRRVQPRTHADLHATMISRMEIHLIQPVAPGIMGAQHRRMDIGQPPLLDGVGTAADGTKPRQTVNRRSPRPLTLTGDGVLQCGVAREQINVLERSALVRNFRHVLDL